MNRGNRKIIVASIVLTLPLAILLGSFSTGAPPYKAAHRASDPAANQQPASSRIATGATKAANRLLGFGTKQPPAASRNYATPAASVRQVAHEQDAAASQVTGGILHAFISGREQSQNRHQHATTQHATTLHATTQHAKTQHPKSGVVPTAGVLDGLVDAIKPSNQTQNRPAAQTQDRQRAVANWDGIPFHAPTQDTAALKRAPIRDPSQAPAPQLSAMPPLAPSGQRSVLVTSPPTSSIQARPVSSRINGAKSILQRAPSINDAMPRVAVDTSKLATEVTSNATELRAKIELSTTESSRRSDRLSMGALDPSEIAAASTSPDAIAADGSLNEQLVPKATRRMIVEATKNETEKIAENAIETKAAVAALVTKKAENELEAIKSKVASAPKVAVPTVEVEMKPQAKPVPKTAVTASPKLATSQTTTKLSAPNVSAQLKKPAPLKIETATQQLAVAPAPVPMKLETAPPLPSAVLSAPVTKTTIKATAPEFVELKPRLKVQAPSASVAHRGDNHRTGPPADAFENSNGVAPKFAPIGSGVVDAGDNESLPRARLAQTPRQYETNYDNSYRPEAYTDRSYTNDPYTARPYVDANSQAASQVTRPMRSAPATTPSMESNFQARTSTAIANDMRPSTQGAIASPAQSVQGQAGVASELPGIRVVTHGPKQIMIRQTHQFEIRVENRGSIDAQGVMVRAMIPDWAEVRGQNASTGNISPDNKTDNERLVWTIDQLPAGTSETMFVRLKAERSGTHGLDVDWTLMPQKSVTTIEVREPRLELTIEGPEEVVFGQSQTYRVRVLNPGDGIAPNVVFTLSPNSPTPQTQRIGDIPPGKEAQFEVELTAQDLGDLKIAGLASGDLELRAEAAKTIRVSAAKLEAMLTGPELKYQNSEASYNLEIANKGSATSEKITATLQLPAGAKYIGGFDKAVQRGSMLTWEVDSLPPTAVRNYKFQCMMNTTGDQMFAFDCKGSAAGHANVSLVTRVESIADLVMTINDPAAPAPVGDDVIYEIVIRNRGSKAAADVRAIAQFSHGIEPRRVEGQSGELLTGQVLFDPIDRIGAGEEIRLKIVANATRPGHHRFRSEIRSGDTILVAEEATHYMNPKSDRVSRRSSENQTR